MVSDAADAGDASATDAPVGYDVVIKPDVAPPPPVDGGTPCNDVAILGPDVINDNVAQSPPTFPVFDQPPPPATYALMSLTVYTGTGGNSGPGGTKTSVTLRIENDQSTWQIARLTEGQPVVHETYQVGKSANGYVLVGTCGTNRTSPIAFVPINSPGFVLVAGTGASVTELFRPFIK